MRPIRSLPSWQQDLGCVFVLLLVTAAFLNPLWALPAYLYSLGGDVLHNEWIWSRNLANVLSGASPSLPNILYPDLRASFYSEMELGNTILYAAFYSLSGNEFVAYAAILVVSFVLTGFMAYRIARILGADFWPGLWAAVLTAFFAYRYAHLAHIQALCLYWALIPIYFVLAWLLRGRKADLAGAVVAMLPVCAGPSYNLVILAIAGTGIFISLLPVASKVAVVRKRLTTLALCAVIPLLLSAPIWWEYYSLFRAGVARSPEFNDGHRVDLAWLFVTPTNNKVYGDVARDFHALSSRPIGKISSVFPGFVALALLAWAFAAGVARRRDIAVALGGAEAEPNLRYPIWCAFAVLAPFYLFLALGKVITWNDMFVMPNGVFALVTRTPLLAATRYIAHYAYPALFAASIVAAVVLTWRLRPLSRLAAGVVMGVLLLGTLHENRPALGIRSFRGADAHHSVPAVYAFLATLPERSSVLFLPLPIEGKVDEASMRQFHYMRHAHRHRLWMANGISGFLPATYTDAMRAFVDFPSAAALGWIADHKLNYIVLDRGAPQFGRLREGALPFYCNAFGKLYDDKDYAVFSVDQSRVRECIERKLSPIAERAAIQVVKIDAPRLARAGAKVKITAVIRNPTDQIWPRLSARDRANPNGQYEWAVERWKDKNAEVVKNLDGTPLQATIRLPHDVQPGQSITVKLDASTPVEPGDYEIAMGMVIQGVRWAFDTKTRGQKISIVQ